MKKTKFGNVIKYKEVFDQVMYIDQMHLVKEKLYDNEKYYTKTDPYRSDPQNLHNLSSKSEKPKYYHSLRKIIFRREEGEGIIIGQTIKKEGEYTPGYKGGWNGDCVTEDEPPYIDFTRVYSFWIVATGINQQVLVPKY
jgi:hypothetical protein